MMSFHDPFQHPAPSSSAAAWRAFPYDDHSSLNHPSLDHHPHPLDHRTLVLPQVPHIPRQPAGFADDHHPQHDNPQLRGDFYYDNEYAYQPQQRHTQHSLFAAPAHFDALHMGHAQPQGWAPGPEQSFRASEQGLRASERFRPSEQAFRSEQSFRPSDHPFPTAFPPFDGFPAGSSHPPPRLEPPSLHPTSRTLGGSSSLSLGGSSSLSLGGPLDGPGGGIFYRSPEHPRLRTAQACEKCRVRKAKCSGDHPSCKRCQARGLACEYAKEGRTRGPNKTKKQQAAEAARAASTAPNGQATTSNGQSRASNSQPRASNSQPRASSTSSEGKGEPGAQDDRARSNNGMVSHADMSRADTSRASHADMSRPTSSLSKPPTPPDMVSHLQKEVNKRMSLPTLPRPHRLSMSMGEHRGARPRPPDLRLETQSLLYRLESDAHHSAVDGHRSAIDGLGRHHDGLQHTARHGETNRRYHDDHTPRRHGHSLSADAVSPGLTPRYPSLAQTQAGMGSSANAVAQTGMSMSGMDSALTSARQSREGSYDGSQGAYNEGGRASFDDGTRGFDDGTRGFDDGTRAFDDGTRAFDDGSYDGSSCSSEGMVYASASDAEMYASAPEAFSHEGSATYSHEGSATYSQEGSATYSHEESATHSRGGSGTSSYSSSLRSPIDSPGGLGHSALASGMVSPVGLSLGSHGMLSPGGNHPLLSPGGHPLLSPGGHPLLSPGGHQMLGYPDDGGAYTDPMAYAGGPLPWTTLNAPQPQTAETFACAGAGKGREYMRNDHNMNFDARDGAQGDEYMRGAEDMHLDAQAMHPDARAMQNDAPDAHAMSGVPGDAQYDFGRGSDGGSSL